MIRWIVKLCEFAECFLREPFSFFPTIFLNFGFDTIEKQAINKFSSYSSKSYAGVALHDSEVASLEKGKYVGFRPFVYCIMFIESLHNQRSVSCNFIVFQTFIEACNLSFCSILKFIKLLPRKLSKFDL